MTHILKTWSEYFEAVRQGRKTFEIRQNDRDFKCSDWLELHEWCPLLKQYTGGVLLARVTYITEWGQKDGFVVMAIKVETPWRK